MSLEDILGREDPGFIEQYDYTGIDFFSKPKIDKEDLAKQLEAAEESSEVRDLYLKDMGSIAGRAANKVMDLISMTGIKRYERRVPDHYVYLDLPDEAGAVTIHTNDGRVILGYNRKHADSIRSNPFIRKYINLHENAHIRGEHSEEGAETIVAKGAEYAARLIEAIKGTTGKLRDVYQEALQIAGLAYKRAQMQKGY